MSNGTTQSLQLTLGFDRSLVSQGRQSVRYLVADIAVPDAPKEQVSSDTPMNLSIVIDASGSMTGAPLAYAKSAARGVIERLQDHDRLSLVSFADHVITHMEPTRLNRDARSRLLQAVAELSTRGCTNLCAGWLEGAEWSAKEMLAANLPNGRVILLSDGHANEGIIDPIQLADIAANLRHRGVYTSAVGIGDGYSPDQLLAISEYGGGRMHDAERPEEIVEVVLGELGESRRTAADDVRLEIQTPPYTKIECLGGCPVSESGSFFTIALGSLVSGSRRQVVLRVSTSEGPDGEVLNFTGRLRWRQPDSTTEVCGNYAMAQLTRAASETLSQQPRDIQRSQLAAQLWLGDMVRESVRRNRRGDYQALREYLDGQRKLFARYCQGLPEGPRMIRQFEQLFGRTQRPMRERSLKEIALRHYKSSRSEVDHRSERRPDWDEYLSE